MKKRQQFAWSSQRTGQKNTRRYLPLSLFQRLSSSWAINALMIPLLISLFGIVVAFLLAHLGRLEDVRPGSFPPVDGPPGGCAAAYLLA